MAAFTGVIYPSLNPYGAENSDKGATYDAGQIYGIFGAVLDVDLPEVGIVTSNLPVSEYPATLTGSVMESFATDYYNSIHITPNPLPLGDVLTDKQKTFTIWNAYLVPQTLSDISPENDGGLTLSDTKVIPYDFLALEERTFLIEASKEGESTIAATYAFTFTSGIAVLAVTGTRIAMWAFPPLRKFSETREWLTAVIRAKAAETRESVRELPRTKLSYTFLLRTREELYSAELLAKANSHRKIGIPDWSNCTKAKGISKDDTIIYVDTSLLGITIGDTLAIWVSYKVFETQTVSAISPTSITLQKGVASSYKKAFIAKILSGLTPKGISFSEVAGSGTTCNVDYTCLNKYSEGIWINGETLASLPVTSAKVEVQEGIASTYARAAITHDSFIGGVDQYNIENYTRSYRSMTLSGVTDVEKYNLQRQLDYMRGRFSLFWVTTHREEFVSVNPLLLDDAELIVLDGGWVKFPPKALQFQGEGFIFNSEVSVVTLNLDGTESLGLTTSLPFSMNKDTTKISLLLKMRSDSDSFEISHRDGIQQVKIPLIEVLD